MQEIWKTILSYLHAVNLTAIYSSNAANTTIYRPNAKTVPSRFWGVSH
ncbi:hypothetical protein [Microcoleus vaginatus]